MEWFGVRCLFRQKDAGVYEERVTIWQAGDDEAAVALAENEANEYASLNDLNFLQFSQVFHLFDPPKHGAEVFSLVRDSTLEPDSYVNRFFDTGEERQGEIDTV